MSGASAPDDGTAPGLRALLLTGAFDEQQRPLVVLVRWAGVIAGIGLTASTPTAASVIIAGVLLAHALVRTVTWRTEPGGRTGTVLLLSEAAAAFAAISATGWWSSPFIFAALAPIVSAGFTFGFLAAIPLAVANGAVITIGTYASGGLDRTLSADGTAEMLLAALIAAYARHLFGQAEERTVTALSRLTQLTEANALLERLNTLALTLPASLDLDETVRSTIEQTRTLGNPSAIVVLLWDATLGSWSLGGAEGARLPTHPDQARLPPPVRAMASTDAPETGARRMDLTTDGPGVLGTRGAGLYAPLVARSGLVGYLIAESPTPGAFDEVDIGLFSGLAEQGALAIDNALKFRRLRTLGAEEERARIARDLHDRVAQSLAYLAFELDRVVDLSDDEVLTPTLDGLRTDVRQLVTELRDTLYDLRTDVSDTSDLASTMAEFLTRVRERTDLTISFHNEASHRLAVPLERELWRIAREAITNVERHADAHALDIQWTVVGRVAEIVVCDDGVGFPPDAAHRIDSYGLVGMRERADAIGARLTIDSAPGRGTRIRCQLEVT